MMLYYIIDVLLLMHPHSFVSRTEMESRLKFLIILLPGRFSTFSTSVFPSVLFIILSVQLNDFGS